MPAYKDEAHGTFYASFYYTDFTGTKRKKMKRGFKLKRDALEWERQFLLQKNADPDMRFGDFVSIYRSEKRERIREHTWESKDNIIDTKILPYFKDRTLSEIEPRDVIAWQNTLMGIRQKNGKPYSPTYLKSIHSQLSAIFNYAVKYYRLKQNPAEIAGNMGKETHKEMLFWTKAEYLQFAQAMMDKPMSYYAFEMLYWCGIRMGELLALTPADFNFERFTLTINKSYQRLKGQDVITEPKTSKSNRVIRIPQVSRRGDAGLSEIAVWSAFNGSHLPHHQELSASRDGPGRKTGRCQTHSDSRFEALPRFTSHRNGILRRGDCRTRRPREHRHHLLVCPPVSR